MGEVDIIPILVSKIFPYYNFAILSRNPVFKNNSILRIKEIYCYLITIFVYKQRRNELPLLFANYFTCCTSLHSHSTRQQNVLRQPMYKSIIGNKGIKCTGVSICNEITKNIDYNVKLGTF